MTATMPKFTWLVRLGYAARGLLYLIIGYLALSAPGEDKTQRGAMSYVDAMPGGTVLMYAIAAGLVGYALFRFCSLLLDIEKHGSKPKGLAVRLGHAGTGAIYLALAWTAFQLAQGHRHAAAGGGGAKAATHTLLTYGFGPLVLGLVGLGLIGGAIAQFRQAVTGKFMRHISPQAPAFAGYAGRAGYAARGVVFAVIGWSLVQSGWLHHGQRLETLDAAIDALRGQGALYPLVGAGLALFGLFTLISSRYRIIREISASDLKPNTG